MSIEKPFRYNPFETGTIYSSTGYLYGVCARRLHYASHYGYIDKADAAILNAGKQKHETIQSTMYKDMQHEVKITKAIPEIARCVRMVGARFDCIDDSRIVEIKPRYSRPAYHQTLIQRFVKPELPIFIFSYVENKEFEIKASFEMSLVYLARIATALTNLPPRIPNASKTTMPCKTCTFKRICFKQDQITWTEFKELSKPIIEKLRQ